LLIPSLEIDAPVVQVSWDLLFRDGAWRTVWQTASDAVGHHRNSANPGEAGNVVLSGHHNTAGEVFREVSEIGLDGARLGEGDELVLVTGDGQHYTYSVVDWERFQESGIAEEERQRHAGYLDQTGEPTLTLVTCWPYESNSHRVVVIARLQP
jgi:LPXTG-site transpeptidase (sortase) family protein